MMIYGSNIYVDVARLQAVPSEAVSSGCRRHGRQEIERFNVFGLSHSRICLATNVMVVSILIRYVYLEMY